MDLDRALRLFKLYCYHFRNDPSEAESMLLTDEERESIQEIRELIEDHAGLFDTRRGSAAMKVK